MTDEQFEQEFGGEFNDLGGKVNREREALKMSLLAMPVGQLLGFLRELIDNDGDDVMAVALGMLLAQFVEYMTDQAVALNAVEECGMTVEEIEANTERALRGYLGE